VTESFSGFFAPEERDALQRREAGKSAPSGSGDPVVIAILTALDARGPVGIEELLSAVRASPRSVISALDALERDRRVRSVSQDGEELVELTADGRSMLPR
jgi:hypothetical protein